MSENDRLTYIERQVGEIQVILARLEEKSIKSEADHARIAKIVESIDQRMDAFEKEHAKITGEIRMLKWVGGFLGGIIMAIAVIGQTALDWVRGR